MAESCPLWRPDECEGTPACPPRCPRYVAPDGTTFTVYRLDDAPERVVRAAGRAFDTPADADRELVAFGTDGPVGRATLSVTDPATGRVELLADATAVVGTELARHLVAHATTHGASTLTVEGPAASLDHLATELGFASRGESLTLPLHTDAAERTTRTPSSRADHAVPRDFSALFDPDRVAVVGATNRRGAIGRVVVENLLSSFEGDVVPVTARHETVLGVPAVDEVAAADADLAVVVLPADAAVDAVREAGASGVEAVAVLSAGFGETDEDGERREAALREAAATYDLTLVGPNALGVLSTRGDLNASFAPTLPDAGGVSVLSHSGAMVTSVLDWAAKEGVGVRDVVSVGNAAGVTEADLLRHWGADAETDVVFAYLEDVSAGEAFVEAAREVSRTTPVVALKSGRSDAGARAAASHTGALVGDDAGFEAAFEDAGVLRAHSQEAAFDLLRAFARQPVPRGDRVAVVTNAGGPGVLATDAVADADCTLASLSPTTVERLRTDLPDAASVANPLDVLGDATVDRFADALDVVLCDAGVDAAMVVSTPHPLVDQGALVRAVGAAGDRHGKPVLTVLSGGPLDADVQDALREASVPNYPDAARAARTLAATARYDRRRREPVVAPSRPAVDYRRVHETLADAGAAGPSAGDAGVTDSSGDASSTADTSVLGVDAMQVLDAYGIPTPRGTLVRSTEEAAAVGARLGGDVVLKVASPDLPHKSDVGGVRVGVAADDIASAYDELLSDVATDAPDADVRGVLVQELVGDGVETVVGVTRHPRFGSVVTFGLGGVFVEHLDDVAHALGPLSEASARRLVRSVDGASVLDGARGADPVDEDALVDALVRLSWLAADLPAVEEVEVNPLVATPDGAVALDLHLAFGGDSVVS